MNRGLVRGDHPPLIPPWMGGGDPANDGLLLGYDTSREGSSGAAQALAPSGLPGATANSRYVGATTSGAPTVGTFKVGDYAIDQTGTLYICITAGTPGTWLPGGSGVELAEAELTADFTLSATTATDITGLSITFTVPSRAFLVELTIPSLTLGAAGQSCNLEITDSANVLLAFGRAVTGSAGTADPSTPMLRSRLPRTGTGSYAVTVGASLTLKARYNMISVGGGNGNIETVSGTSRPILRAVTC